MESFNVVGKVRVTKSSEGNLMHIGDLLGLLACESLTMEQTKAILRKGMVTRTFDGEYDNVVVTQTPSRQE